VTANPWNTALGRNWSHDYAERIVMDPDETHVWLLTRFGSFREFGSLAAGSGLRLYQTVTPSDEYRRLYFNAATQGWQLQGLDGSTEYDLTVIGRLTSVQAWASAPPGSSPMATRITPAISAR
jgi:hypothetical protein